MIVRGKKGEKKRRSSWKASGVTLENHLKSLEKANAEESFI